MFQAIVKLSVGGNRITFLGGYHVIVNWLMLLS